MKITKRQLRRIIKEEKAKLLEAAPGSFGGYDSIVEEVFQEISTYFEEARGGGGDPDTEKARAIETAREAVKADVIWSRLEEALPGLWDEAYDRVSEILYNEIAEEWHMQHH